MSNGIHPLRPVGANPYAQPTAPAANGQSSNQASAPASPPRAQEVQAAQAGAMKRLEGLSPDESAMIQELFPEHAPTSMRLYGPGGTGREVQARALGGRLDLSA